MCLLSNKVLAFGMGTALALMLAMGCVLPPTSSERLIDRARDLNMAARFGRMEIAVEHTSASTRDQFVERRRFWGNEIRVMDINLSGLKRIGEEEAELLVEVAWTRMDEGMLRGTTLKQHWRNVAPGGWQLEREQRVSGDHGLLGDAVTESKNPARPDVHFQTRTLGR